MQNKKDENTKPKAQSTLMSEMEKKAVKIAVSSVKGALTGLVVSQAKKHIERKIKTAARDAVLDKIGMSKKTQEQLNGGLATLSVNSSKALSYLKSKKDEFLNKSGKELTEAEKVVENINEEKQMQINKDTNFVQFVQYVLTQSKYKDKYGDCNIVSFLATKQVGGDIVLGHANEWEKVIEHARLLESSELTKASAKKLTASLVQNLFGKEVAQDFTEHFSPVKKPPVSIASKRSNVLKQEKDGAVKSTTRSKKV